MYMDVSVCTVVAKIIKTLVFSPAKNGFKPVISTLLCSVSVGTLYVPVWLSGRALRLLRKRLWVRFPGNTCTNENV